MTLHVDFDQFAEAAKRHIKGPFAYVSRIENRTHVTASDPAANVIISATTKLGLEEAKQSLISAGLEVGNGGWSDAGNGSGDASYDPPYIAAVAYKSGEEMPGIWVDAYAEMPTPATVLKALYDEFRQTGEVGDMSFEEFVRLANPNITIVSPTEWEHFLSEKGSSEC